MKDDGTNRRRVLFSATGAIRKSADTNNIGDGKICVVDFGLAIRVRTGETDVNAGRCEKASPDGGTPYRAKALSQVGVSP